MTLSEYFAGVDPLVGLVLAWFLGVVVRVLWPYFMAGAKTLEPPAWDWNYLIGQVFGALLALLPTVAAADFAEQLGVLGLVGAFAFGYGGASFGRNGQKQIMVAKAPRPEAAQAPKPKKKKKKA